MKLIEVPRYHVIRMDGKLYELVDSYIGAQGNVQFGWHRIYRDGRTNMHGKCTFDREFVETKEVEDLGDFYEWMRKTHPIRFKREKW